MIKISTSMIDHYLSGVTVSWYNDNEVPPDDINEYLPLVEWMKQNAINHGDLAYLKIGLEYILTRPYISYDFFNGGRYPYLAHEIKAIIEFTYRTIWSEKLPTKPDDNVQLVLMPLEEWWATRQPLEMVVA